MTVTMQVRAAHNLDIPFLTDSWLKSFQGSYHVKKLPAWLYRQQHHKIVTQLLARSLVLVACDEAAPNVIWGWTCAEMINDTLVVHYTYVKEAFRGFGIASKLIAELLAHETPEALVYTHDTKSANSFLDGLRGNGTLNPGLPTAYNFYLLYDSLPSSWSAEYA